MKRKDFVQSLLGPQPGGTASAFGSSRVASGAVRAMGLELSRLNDEASAAERLREQIAAGGVVLDLDPARVEPSFVADRLARNADADYRKLVDSIRTSGQQVPILVRPHPERPETYQIAFGHRRRDAALELGQAVRAIVRPLSDQDLVVAQGKENAERRDLSFIERALFAASLERRGFPRATLNAALGVQTSEMTRLLAVAHAVPAEIVTAIGPAPKAGRPRWLELARMLDNRGTLQLAHRTVGEASFAGLSSDRRFETLFDRLRGGADSAEPILFHTRGGAAVVRGDRQARVLRLSVDEKALPGLADRLLAELPELIAAIDTE
jgi:ParB family chromosome partitioning protein